MQFDVLSWNLPYGLSIRQRERGGGGERELLTEQPVFGLRYELKTSLI